MKKTTKIMLGIALVLSIIMGTQIKVSPVQAAAPSFDKSLTLYCYPDDEYESEDGEASYGSCEVNIENPTSKGKIKGVSSSDESVVTADGKGSSISFGIHGIGKSEVRFQYAGKKFTCKVTVKEWVNPCKSLKLGKKQCARFFDKSAQFNLLGQKSKTVKLSVEPASGWKLKKITCGNYDTGMKKLTNNKVFKISTGGTGTALYSIFENKETKEKVVLYLGYADWEKEKDSENIYEQSASIMQWVK